MLRWVVESCLKFRLLIAVLASGLLVAGFLELRNTHVDALPEFSPPYIEVQTEALGLSAEEVEQLITVPLEADLLNGVAFLQEIRSDSVPGLSSIVMIFEPGTDLYRARQLVSERMTQAHALPQVSKPPVMLEPVSSSSRAMVLEMSSDTRSLIDQSVMARWTIRPKLLGVPGVSNVAVFGERDRQLQVQVDPAVLHSKGLGLSDIMATAGNATWVSPLTFLEASTPGTGGFIDTPNQRLGIQNISPIVNAQTLGQVPIEEHPGLLLGDVTKLVEDHQLLIGDGIVGQNSGLVLVIEKFPYANTVEVSRGIEEALRDLAPGLGDIRIDSTVYRPASYVEAATSNLAISLGIGLGLALLIIGLFLYTWRTIVVAAAALTVAVAFAVTTLKLFGLPINLLVVMGLVAALLVVIDDAVRDTRALGKRMLEGGEAATNGGRLPWIVSVVMPLRRSAVYAALIVALAVTPVFFVSGSIGEVLRPAAAAYLIGLLAAMAVALLVTPALTSLLYSESVIRRLKDRPEARPVLGRMHRPFQGLAARVQPRVRTGLAVGVALVALGALLVPFLAVVPMPELKERNLLVSFNGSAGVGRTEMIRVTTAASAELRALPGVAHVGAHVGRARQSDQVADVDAGEIWVRIDPDADYDGTVAAVREVIDGYPGLSRSVQTYLDGRSSDAFEAAGSELVVRVYGEDPALLAAKATEVQQLISGVDGLDAASVRQVALRPTLLVEVDLAKAQQFNIKPGDVRRTVATLLSGIVVGSIFENQKVFEVVVWGTDEVRGNLTAVQNLMVDRPDGAGQVRVGDVASVRVAATPAVVQREASSRYIDVSGIVQGRTHAAVVDDVRQLLSGMQFPFDHRAEVLVATDTTQGPPVAIVALVALAIIVLLLQVALNSWALAALVLLVLPVALAGGLIATAVAGRIVSLGTFAGLLALAAIYFKQAVSLVGHSRQWVADEQRSHGLMAATRQRVEPVIVTSLALAAVSLPVVIAGPIAGLELLHPLAVTVLGGTVTCAAAILLVLPGLCAGTKHGKHHAIKHADDKQTPESHAHDEVRGARSADDEFVGAGALA